MKGGPNPFHSPLSDTPAFAHFMTGALYADTQAIIQNIVFSLAKQQILDATQIFYIILDGTD
jgi:hypothetical protein